MLDSPRSPEVIGTAVEIAEKLRVKYDIDTGNAFEDRTEAAQRAQVEFLDRLAFSEEELSSQAASLGYSLDPARCANYCDNVRELAAIELQKLALAAFADNRPWPGRLGDEPIAGPPGAQPSSSVSEDPDS